MYLRCLVIVALVVHGIHGAPVDQKNPSKKSENEIDENVADIDQDKQVDHGIDENEIEYGRYLRQVMDALDSDKEFQKKVENITHDQILSGQVARQIEVVSPEVRSRLDELKRIEIERLRKLTMKEHQLELEQARNSPDANNDPSISHHVDHSNPHTFEAEDLQKLILKATADLEELDRKRRRDFKQYEMEKEVQYRDSLQNMTADQRAEVEKKHEEAKKKHQEHAKVHHPGSKQQLEQVWEEQDQMPRQEFDPKVFFQLHDVNGDGFLDQEEVESLLSIEVRKLYNEKDPSYDKNEMLEEYHRMREDIYREIDANKDGLISKKEFIDYSNKPEFNKDEGWKGIEEAPVYSEEELKQYEQQRHQEALARHYEQYGAYYAPPPHPSQGVYQQHPGAYQQPVYYQAHPGQPPQLQPQQHVQYVVNAPAQHVQVPTQYHHVELPPAAQQHPQQGQQHYQQMPAQQGYQQAQQNYHPNQAAAIPPAQVHPGQQPQQYQQAQQPPQQYHQPQGHQPVNYGLPQNQQHSPPPQQYHAQQQQQAPPPAQHH